MRKIFAPLLLALPLGFAGAGPAMAGKVENAGTAVALALPLIAGGISIYKDDWIGVAQMGVDTGASLGVAYGLKHFVKEQRPDKSDFESFPSDTAALAFAPAQFLWDRYGWQYGVPAYAAAAFVGWSRVDAKKHHWYDVAASAAISFTVSKIFTTEYRGRGFSYTASAAPDGGSIHLSYNF